jgi:flagella basal body P-ring formation protein FlgA
MCIPSGQIAGVFAMNSADWTDAGGAMLQRRSNSLQFDGGYVHYRALQILMVTAALSGITDFSRADVGAHQDMALLQRIVQQFLRVQTAGLPGQTSFSSGPVDLRVALSACPAPEAFLPPGARLWGNSTVGVRCSGDKPWTIFVPVHVHVMAEYLVAAHPLNPGAAIGAADIASRIADLTELPAGIVTDAAQAIGKTPSANLGAGQALRADMLRDPIVVQNGQSVILQSKGAGFTVRAEGKALSQAADGQVIQVRSASGSTVSGIARAGGVVEVTF